MSISREDLRAFLRQCDPKLPLMGGDPRYVPLDDVRGGDGLLERWLVLAYRNGVEWYDLHPMVRRDPMVAERLKQS